MTLPLIQRFSGGADGVAVTAANSGTTGNNAFDIVSAGTGSTTNQYSATQAIHSLLSGEVATSVSGGAAYWAWTTSIGGARSQLYGRAYLYLTASPAATDSVIQFKGLSGTVAGGIQVTTGRVLQLLNASGGVGLTFTSVIPLNQWVRVEFNIGVLGGSSSLAVQYYASADSTTSTESHTDSAGPYGGTGGFAEVDYGWTNSHASQPVTYFDSLQLNDTGPSGPDPGAMPVPSLPGVPVFQLLAGFGAQAGQFPAYTDISAHMRNFQMQRAATRLQGPLYQFHGGTLSALLKDGSGVLDPDNLHGPYVSTTGLQTRTVRFFAAGSFTWTAPANLVGNADVVCVAGGGGGGGMSSVYYIYNGGGGGGGEYAEEPNLAVTAGLTYTGTVGAGGTAGGLGSNGGAGGSSTFTGDSVTVTAHGGGPGTHGTTSGGGVQGGGGAGGSGSANTVSNPGGNGGPGGGAPNFNGGGGGGGGSGGSGLPGNAGGGASAQYPGYGARPVPGGGAGGGRDHENGYQPGGGGGGGWLTSHGSTGPTIGVAFPGAPGWVTITYVVTVPAAASTEVTGNVPLQLNAYWPDPSTGIFAHLFTGLTDGWQDSGQNIPGYAEVTVTATDLTKLLALAFLPAIPGAGAGEDSGARITRILNSAGFSSINVTSGDTALQAETQGSYALDRCQVTSDTEAGEFYIDTDGTPFFRHRQGLLADFRSMFPQAVFSDLPNGAGPSGSVAWWDFENGTTMGWTGSNCTVANSTMWAYGPGAARSLLVTASAAAAGAGFWQVLGPNAPGVAVVPGELHGAEATVWTSGGTAINQISIAIDWYTAGGVFISQSPATPAAAIPPGQAVHLSMHGLRAPAGAAQAYVVIIDNEGSPAGTQFWVDYVLFDPVLEYTQPGRANDTTTLANDVQYTRPGGTMQQAKSLTSIAANQGTVSYQRSDVMYNTDADALRGAQWVLSVSLQSEDRVDTLEILPRRDPYGINPHVLTRRIGDKIRFIRHPPGVITPVVRDLYIKGITISWDASASVYTLTWQTMDTAKYGAYIVLDDPYAGRTDFAGVAY